MHGHRRLTCEIRSQLTINRVWSNSNSIVDQKLPIFRTTVHADSINVQKFGRRMHTSRHIKGQYVCTEWRWLMLVALINAPIIIILATKLTACFGRQITWTMDYRMQRGAAAHGFEHQRDTQRSRGRPVIENRSVCNAGRHISSRPK